MERRSHKKNKNSTFNLELKNIKPITENQKNAFKSFHEKNLILTGSAGTGKSFISLYLSLQEIFGNKSFAKLIIIRSALATRDIGFLKGTEKEKVAVYEQPYEYICNELFNRGDAYSILAQKGILEFMSTSYLRGLTFDDSIVFVDEIQNITAGELNTIMTRLGKDSKIIFSGDINQSDAKKDRHDFLKFINVVSKMEEFHQVNFTTDDVVRSGIVKNYIITKEKLGVDF